MDDEAAEEDNESVHSVQSDEATATRSRGDARRYEDAVLRIIRESLVSAGQRTSALLHTQRPLLAEVRRRMRADREMLRSMLRGRETRREALRSASRTVAGVPGKIRYQITRRVRKRITGAEGVRVRDHFRSRMEEPPVVRFRDKVSFMLGVCGCALIEFFVLAHPHLYPYCYAAFAIPLLVMRWCIYRSLKWHLFLFDFCYFVNLSCLVQLLMPTSRQLILINFAHTMGPLAMAIPTWRNSLVFHSLDKVTSVFIHGGPPLLLFCVRWFPAAHIEPSVADPVSAREFLTLGMGGYVFWQLLYVFVTEVVYAASLRANDDMMTSTRWLTTPPYSGITAFAYMGCKKVGIMRAGELFDSESWKCKLIFMGVQLLYTLATLVVVPFLWNSYYTHLAYLILIYTICVWNGGSYYIEVFSKAYRTQFDGDAATRRAKALESYGAPKRGKPPTNPSSPARGAPSSPSREAVPAPLETATDEGSKKDD
ncbi:hypothetical protein AB1Y20_020717 [Prymnesium parvum]|uniref:Glycerophosphocholine acyltransferase 1 n=1 Tax=Prymnesium parvum TaxID=97485 RepID=A0AB34JVZ2_PRYPA